MLSPTKGTHSIGVKLVDFLKYIRFYFHFFEGSAFAGVLKIYVIEFREFKRLTFAFC